MDRPNSDLLMEAKAPLNRYILELGFLRVDLGTSLDMDLGPGSGPGSGSLGPGSGPGSGSLDPSISDLRIYLIIQFKRPYEPIYLSIP